MYRFAYISLLTVERTSQARPYFLSGKFFHLSYLPFNFLFSLPGTERVLYIIRILQHELCTVVF